MNAMPLFKKTRYSTVRTAPKKDIPAGLWLKCKGCEGTLYQSSLAENGQVCPKCDFHYPLTAAERIALLTDAGSFQEIDPGLRSVDALQFAGGTVYSGKLQEARVKTGLNDAVVCGTATLDGRRLGLGVMDFRFMGASMGSVVGEKVTRLAELSTREGLPLVIATASGGARMQEGMLSLMQMAKTSAALAYHHRGGLPYLSVLTNPTMAGIMASFAALGDITLAEPKALIGFTGPRVIEQTIRQKLPPGFQRSEFLQEHGMIDIIVNRKNMKNTISLLLDYLANKGV